MAGTFTVVGLLAAALLAGLAYFFFRRRRRRQLDEDLRVAAGGAGAGGAGIARFDDDDDDLEDPFNPPSGSENAFAPSPHMSQYNSSAVPIAAGAGIGAAAGFGFAAADHERRTSGAYSNHRLSYGSDPYGSGFSNQSHVQPYPAPAAFQSSTSVPGSVTAAPTPGVYGGYTYASPQLGHDTARSHEGALYDDWAEYVHAHQQPPDGAIAPGAYSAAAVPVAGQRSSLSNEGSLEGAQQGSAATSLNGAHLPASTPSSYSLSGQQHSAGDNRLQMPVQHENESQVSFQDDQDYSRRILRVANPEDD